MLILYLISCPESFAKTLNCDDLFTVEYPDEWVNFGADSSYDTENAYYNLGMIGGYRDDELTILIALLYFEGYADLRLFDADDDAVSEFARNLMEDFYCETLLEFRTVGDYAIPFVLIRGQDDYGDFVLASTISNGWCILMDGYAYEDDSYETFRDLTDEDIAQFIRILDTFEPILGGEEA